MQRFADRSIKSKVLILMTSLMIAVVTILSGVLLVVEFARLREAKQTEISGIAKILAKNLEAPLAFRDSKAASDVLESIKTNPSLDYVKLTDESGQVFSSLLQNKNFSLPSESNLKIHDPNRVSHLSVEEPIILDQKKIGKLTVYANLDSVKEAARQVMLVVLLVAGIASAIASLLIYVFQARILAPILSLAKVAEHVSSTSDYTVRLKANSKDEVGTLVSGFNTMLNEVARRDSELKLAKDNLEARVVERTRELEKEIRSRKDVEIALRREQELLRGVVRNAPVAMAMFDEHMRYLAYSDRWQSDNKLSGNLLGKGYYDLSPNTPQRIKEMHRKCLQGETLSCNEDKFEHDDGGSYYLRWAMHPWWHPHGQQGGLIVVTQPIDDLVSAREEAIKSAERRSQFFTNISHELRTPLNGVIGFTELLEGTSLTPEQLDYVGTVRASGKLLLALINDVLDFAKIDSKKMELEYRGFKFHDLVQNIVNLFTPLAAQKGLSLKYKTANGLPNWLMGDETRVKQILMNLLGNALKFTEKGSLSLDVELTEKTASTATIRFSVTDTGVGIPSDKLETIFDVFSQADGTITRKFGGTGLGLAISRQLVHLMAGRIWVESRLGAGSTFHFVVKFDLAQPPARYRQENAIEIIPGAACVISKQTILVVEDNLVNQKLITALLKKRGFAFTIAENGQLAVERTADTKFDLILMDVQMPVMGGIDATEAIRANATNPNQNTPIVALTAHAFEEDKLRCLRAGMNDYLTKPIKSDEFDKALARWLAQNDKTQTATADHQGA